MGSETSEGQGYLPSAVGPYTPYNITKTKKTKNSFPNIEFRYNKFVE